MTKKLRCACRACKHDWTGHKKLMKPQVCPKCGSPAIVCHVVDNFNYELMCQNCGTMNDIEDERCNACGGKLDKNQTIQS